MPKDIPASSITYSKNADTAAVTTDHPNLSRETKTWSFLPLERYQRAQAHFQWKSPAHTTTPTLPQLQAFPRYGWIGWLATAALVGWVFYTRSRIFYICLLLLLGSLLEVTPPRPYSEPPVKTSTTP